MKTGGEDPCSDTNFVLKFVDGVQVRRHRDAFYGLTNLDKVGWC